MSGRILIEDRCQYKTGGGIRTYIDSIVTHWPAESGLELVGFRRSWNRSRRIVNNFDRQAIRKPDLRPLSQLFERVGPPRDASATLRLLYSAYRAAFAAEARRGKYAAAFEPNHLCAPSGLPTVTTMHDLSVMEHPEWHTPSRVARWNKYLPRTVSQTSQWIAVSQFTRERMVRHLGVAASRITVIPEAARQLPPVNIEIAKEMREALGNPTSFFLHLGTIEPRKNIPLLLNAYQQLPPATRRAVPLILVGTPGWGNEDFWNSLIQHPMAGDVLVSGYLSDLQLAALLTEATAVLLPSFYEGFGLPVLEAMNAGCSVACSDIEAFREAAEGVAEFLPTGDCAAWSAFMERAIEDHEWRRQSGIAGRARAQTFSWKMAADAHARVVLRAVRGE